MTTSGDVTFDGLDQIESLDVAGSAIYRARDVEHNQLVAVKVLDPLAEPIVPRRFELKRRSLSAFADHGDVVPILDSGTTIQGRHYLVMPFYPNGSLADLLANGPTPWQRAAELVMLTAQSVGAAHELGLTLGDLKPSSILLADPETPVIAVYGMATRRFDNGTPSYAAPEAARGASLAPTADVYSLTLILAALIAGKAPPRGRPSAEFLAQVRQLSPSRIEQVIDYGLSIDTSQRYGTAARLARALAAAVHGRPVTDTAVVTRRRSDDYDLDTLMNGYPAQRDAARRPYPAAGSQLFDATPVPDPELDAMALDTMARGDKEFAASGREEFAAANRAEPSGTTPYSSLIDLRPTTARPGQSPAAAVDLSTVTDGSVRIKDRADPDLTVEMVDVFVADPVDPDVVHEPVGDPAEPGLADEPGSGPVKGIPLVEDRPVSRPTTAESLTAESFAPPSVEADPQQRSSGFLFSIGDAGPDLDPNTQTAEHRLDLDVSRGDPDLGLPVAWAESVGEPDEPVMATTSARAPRRETSPPPADEAVPVPFRSYEPQSPEPAPSGRLVDLVDWAQAAVFNRRRSIGGLLAMIGLAMLAFLALMLVLQDLRATQLIEESTTTLSVTSTSLDEPAVAPPTAQAPLLVEPPATGTTAAPEPVATVRRATSTAAPATSAAAVTSAAPAATAATTAKSVETTAVAAPETVRTTAAAKPATTAAPVTTAAAKPKPESVASPRIQRATASRVRATTARVSFSSPSCVTASFSYAPSNGSATSVNGDSSCSRSHSLLLGLVTAPLSPGTSYSVTITATDRNGAQATRTISFTTLG